MLQIFDPHPPRHDYVSRMYFEPMLHYAADHGIPCQRVDTLVPSKGAGMICDADYLTPEVVRHFKENSCELFGFSCIDSAYLPEVLRYAPEMLLVNRIFMVAGIQNTNTSMATFADDQFQLRAEPRQFLPDEAWARFDFMRQRGALQSLPYPPWYQSRTPAWQPFEQRRPTILFRGGAHFMRVVAYFVALRAGCADPASGFNLRPYFLEEMAERFRFCAACRDHYRAHGGTYPRKPFQGRGECNSPADWGGELSLANSGRWNNRCPESFYWLAEQFAKVHGAMDMDQLAQAMSFVGQSDEDHLKAVGSCRFYADAKWEFTINAAQRFWEAASVGTINLLPRRTRDQDYFPAIKEGEHYLTFADDLSGMTAEIGLEQFEHITEATMALWERWMKPSGYAISTNLLKHIFDLILYPRNS